MFGFLPAPCSACNQSDASTYRSFFCGLSSTLAKEFGHAARFLTNRDGTFVSLLVAAQQEQRIESSFTTCCNPIGRKRALFDVGEHARYAAAISVCGVYTKLKDEPEYGGMQVNSVFGF